MPAASVVPLRGQHSPSTLTQRPAAQQPQPQPPSTQALANFLELLNSIPSSPNYQVAEEILNEMTVLRNQLQSKEKELEQVKKAKEIAVNEMFDVNEAQKSKQKEIALEMDSLKKSIQLAKDALSQKEREIHAFDGQYRKVQADLTQVQSDLKTAQHDIDGLQKKVKEKDLLIDKVKASHSEGQKRSKAAEERVAAMEKEKSALAESLQAAKARLDKIEGYTTQHSNCDEDSM
jgi:chromosome segregation ATPase